jgi:hypothetical protein
MSQNPTVSRSPPSFSRPSSILATLAQLETLRRYACLAQNSTILPLLITHFCVVAKVQAFAQESSSTILANTTQNATLACTVMKEAVV